MLMMPGQGTCTFHIQYTCMGREREDRILLKCRFKTKTGEGEHDKSEAEKMKGHIRVVPYNLVEESIILCMAW